MTRKNVKRIYFQYIECLYIYLDMIESFYRNIRFPSIGPIEDVILESCLETKRDNMAYLGGLFTSHFCLHVPVIHELDVLIPFAPFEADFLETTNVSPS